MREGLSGENYLIVFDDDERAAAADRYGLASALPGCILVGLSGWDDFLVRDAHGRLFRVPTVPCVSSELEPFPEAVLSGPFRPDTRFIGRIKWYVQPIVFGGDPKVGDNLTWVTHEQHGQLVRWWNERYLALAGNNR